MLARLDQPSWWREALQIIFRARGLIHHTGDHHSHKQNQDRDECEHASVGHS
jgi:hypothetical protein